jgi:hypothetical protein
MHLDERRRRHSESVFSGCRWERRRHRCRGRKAAPVRPVRPGQTAAPVRRPGQASLRLVDWGVCLQDSKECGDVQQQQMLSDSRHIRIQSGSLTGCCLHTSIGGLGDIEGRWRRRQCGGYLQVSEARNHITCAPLQHYCHGVLALQTVNPICQQAPVDCQHSIAGWCQTCIQSHNKLPPTCMACRSKCSGSGCHALQVHQPTVNPAPQIASPSVYVCSDVSNCTVRYLGLQGIPN